MSHQSDQVLRRVWAERLERFSSSGLTIIDFCKREGTSTASFYHWRKRLRTTEAASKVDEPSFVPVHVNDDHGTITIRIPGGMTVELPAGTSSRNLQEILAACIAVISVSDTTEPAR